MGIFNRCTNLESIEFKVPMVCLVTGCVSGRRDARYNHNKRKLSSHPLTMSSNLSVPWTHSWWGSRSYIHNSVLLNKTSCLCFCYSAVGGTCYASVLRPTRKPYQITPCGTVGLSLRASEIALPWQGFTANISHQNYNRFRDNALDTNVPS